MNDTQYQNEAQLDKLQFQIFSYFWHEGNPLNGLVTDKTAPDWPAGTAATGLALTSYPIAVERGFISRDLAVERTLATLRFFRNSRHGPEPEATGHHGFYYRFLDMIKGRRARISEISFIDTSLFLAGALTAALYFNDDTSSETEIRSLADELYLKADWQWALNGGTTFLHGWKPETGFLKSRSKGYDEAMLMYILSLGSPSFPIPENSYAEWVSTFEWINSHGYEHLYAGPLLIHQLPHVWIDFRGIQDEFMESKGIDYFENSERATRVQQLYAIENTGKFEGYGKYFWGLTISDGPCSSSLKVNGKGFLGHARRGVPYGPDDGTVSPWSAVTSLPFAPDIVLPLIERLLKEQDMNIPVSYGFKSSYNPTFTHKPHSPYGWRSPWHYATNQGPAMPLIENFRTGFLWDMMKNSNYISEGLRMAGFKGGWLMEKQEHSRVRYHQPIR